MKIKTGAMLCFILSISLLVACSNNNDKQTDKKQEILVSVKVEDIKSKSISSDINVTSKIEPISEIAVFPKMAGVVKSVNVKAGDIVSKGDILFTLDDKDLRMQIDSASAQLNTVEANKNLSLDAQLTVQINQLESAVENTKLQYENLLENLEKIKELYEEGAVAKNELDTIQNNVDILKLQLDSAKQTLELNKNAVYSSTKEVTQANVNQAIVNLSNAQKQLDNTVIRSEISGVITGNVIALGSMASPSTPAMSITNMDSVKVKFEISEDNINNVKLGQNIAVRISAISDDILNATITNVSNTSNKQTLLYPVEAILDNSSHIIKPGMFASVNIPLARKENIIAVPINSIIIKDDEKYVFIIDSENIVHKRVVTTGMENDTQTEITSGLNISDKVIVSGQDFVSDGVKVNVVKE